MSELDAMQAPPAIAVLIRRAEKRGRSQHVDPSAQAVQDDEVAPVGRGRDARYGEEVDTGSADAAVHRKVVEQVAQRRQAVEIIGRRQTAQRAVDYRAQHARTP